MGSNPGYLLKSSLLYTPRILTCYLDFKCSFFRDFYKSTYSIIERIWLLPSCLILRKLSMLLFYYSSESRSLSELSHLHSLSDTLKMNFQFQAISMQDLHGRMARLTYFLKTNIGDLQTKTETPVIPNLFQKVSRAFPTLLTLPLFGAAMVWFTFLRMGTTTGNEYIFFF